MKKLLCLLALGLVAVLNAAPLECTALISDFMVLQRNKPVAVWGWADAGETVTVEFNGQKKRTKADGTGKWSLKLDPMSANARSQIFLVTGSNQSSDTTKPRLLEFKDVLVGEVWLGSGQSNMERHVFQCANAEAEKAAGNHPLIRQFAESSPTSETPQQRCKGSWKVCTPETVSNFSATLYYMGRELQQDLDVPVGLIVSAVGGTGITWWASADAQATDPDVKANYDTNLKSYEAWSNKYDPVKSKEAHQAKMAAWQIEADKAKVIGQPEPVKPRDTDASKKKAGAPAGLFNGKIAPLVPYSVRGIIWYQGEHDATEDKASLYNKQLTALILDWRKLWGEELPFAWAQLPNYIKGAGEGWPLMRESMLKTLSVPKTGMVISIDIGETNDIHPKNKQEIGRRFALWALGDVYGKKVPETSGPLPAGNEIKGGKIILSFTHANGLKARDGKLRGFTIAGADKVFVPADATIEGGKVIVSAATVKAPVAARYAWHENPDCNLVNDDNLPASPFRTDAPK